MSINRGFPHQPSQKIALRTARCSVAAMFFVSGAVLSNWVTCIPEIQQKLGLSNGTLGVALLGMSVGLLLTTPITGWLIARMGSNPITKMTALAYCLALALPALAPNFLLLVTSLVIFGAASGAMSVAINAQGLAVEQRYGRPIMSSFHGMFSVGGLVGAVAGGVVISLRVTPILHLLGAAFLLGIVAILASRWLLPSGVVTDSHRPVFTVPNRSLLGLKIVAFCSLLGEGAMADWSVAYFRQVLETEPGLAAGGYAVFSLAMACGRFTGDRSSQHFGPVKIVRFSGTLAAIGLMLSLIISQPMVAIIGFAFFGIGLSSIIPLVFSAAGRTPGIAPSVALAGVATTGYFGFLLGPPLIGFAAELLTLRGALGLVVVSSAIIAVLAQTVARPREPDLCN